MKVDEVTIKLAFRAAKSGESKLLSQLLEKHGSSLANDRNEHNDTPLMFAAMTGLHTVVRCLLKHGSDVYAKNDDDSTALMTAAMSGNAKCVRLLLKASTEDDFINWNDINGRTSLNFAASSQSAACVRLLLDRGSDPFLRNANGKTAAQELAAQEPDAQEPDAQEPSNIKAIVRILQVSMAERLRRSVEAAQQLMREVEADELNRAKITQQM
eukprot:997370_1